MSDAEFPYPMWVVSCATDGFICTVWEKPGTGCAYMQQCPSCGGSRIETTRVTDEENHNAHIERVNAQAEK